MEIIDFILLHWIEWLFTIIIAVLSCGYRKLKEERDKTKSITEWVKALLCESITT